MVCLSEVQEYCEIVYEKYLRLTEPAGFYWRALFVNISSMNIKYVKEVSILVYN
jgi:hypothetical protein